MCRAALPHSVASRRASSVSPSPSNLAATALPGGFATLGDGRTLALERLAVRFFAIVNTDAGINGFRRAGVGPLPLNCGQETGR